MMALSLGPLALPTAPLLLLLSTLAAQWVAARVAARRAGASVASDAASAHAVPPAPGTRLTRAVLVALLLARLGHVASHHAAYLAEPWAVLDLRDGGWHAGAGLVGGLAWQARRAVGHRRALAAGAAAGVLLWSAGVGVLGQMAPRELPDLVLTDLATGQPVRLRDVAARRPVVLNLWATWCGHCRRELPVLGAAQARHPDVVFLFVNQGEGADTARRYLDAQRLALAQVLLDPPARLGPALGSAGLPTTVFFDRQGRRVDAHLGALNAAALSARIAAILPP